MLLIFFYLLCWISKALTLGPVIPQKGNGAIVVNPVQCLMNN